MLSYVFISFQFSIKDVTPNSSSDLLAGRVEIPLEKSISDMEFADKIALLSDNA